MAFFYAVRKGRRPGVYSTWKECKTQTSGYSGKEFRKFSSEQQAYAYINNIQIIPKSVTPIRRTAKKRNAESTNLSNNAKKQNVSSVARTNGKFSKFHKTRHSVPNLGSAGFKRMSKSEIELAELKYKFEVLNECSPPYCYVSRVTRPLEYSNFNFTANYKKTNCPLCDGKPKLPINI